jgi:hypothetical protein
MRIGVGVKPDVGKGIGVKVEVGGGIGSQQPAIEIETRIRIGIRRFIVWFLLSIDELMDSTRWRIITHPIRLTNSVPNGTMRPDWDIFPIRFRKGRVLIG